MTTSEQLLGYSNFAEIEDKALQTWNRVNTIYNIKERFDDIVASEYASQFEKWELIPIYFTMIKVAKDGYENVRREIMKETISVG